MSDLVAVALVGCLQAVSVAFLDLRAHQRAKRACGSASCVKAIEEALHIRVERTPGTVAVNGVTPKTPGP